MCMNVRQYFPLQSRVALFYYQLTLCYNQSPYEGKVPRENTLSLSAKVTLSACKT